METLFLPTVKQLMQQRPRSQRGYRYNSRLFPEFVRSGNFRASFRATYSTCAYNNTWLCVCVCVWVGWGWEERSRKSPGLMPVCVEYVMRRMHRSHWVACNVTNSWTHWHHRNSDVLTVQWHYETVCGGHRHFECFCCKYKTNTQLGNNCTLLSASW